MGRAHAGPEGGVGGVEPDAHLRFDPATGKTKLVPCSFADCRFFNGKPGPDNPCMRCGASWAQHLERNRRAPR